MDFRFALAGQFFFVQNLFWIGEKKKSLVLSLPTEKKKNPSERSTMSQLLVDKYRPKTSREIIGNQSNVTAIRTWLQRWRPEQELARGLLLQGEPGRGKCWGKGTRLLLFDGRTKAVEDICEGDQLMGDDNTARTVQPGSLTRGNTALDGISAGTYRITSKNGGGRSTWTCNGDHILVLRWNMIPSVVQRLDSATLLGEQSFFYFCTWELRDNGVLPARHVFDSEVEALEARTVALQEWVPLEWQVTVDDFLRSPPGIQNKAQMFQPELVQFAPPVVSIATKLGRPPHNDKDVAHVARLIGGWLAAASQRSPALGNILRDYGIGDSGIGKGNDDDAHIPLDLLRESLEVRLHLLAGIIDGPGGTTTVGGGREFQIAAHGRRFIDDLVHLCGGLGLQTSAVHHEPHTGFSITVRGSRLSAIPTTKLVVASNPRDQRGAEFRVEQVEHADYYGFTLDGNGRCLMSDFVVTHNTSSALVVCRELGLRVIEYNASDARTASAIEALVRPFLMQVSSSSSVVAASPPAGKKRKPSASALKKAAASMTVVESDEAAAAAAAAAPSIQLFQQATLAGFFAKKKTAPAVAAAAAAPCPTPTTVILMDEVDGMEGNSDRGGLVMLCNMIARAGIPIICIGNDCSDKRKFGTLQKACQCIQWSEPTPNEIITRISAIAREEKLPLDAAALRDLVTEQHGDIRQILNALQFWCGGAGMARTAKDVNVPVFDLVREVFARREANESSEAIEERAQAHFGDAALVPLFVHENYARRLPPQAPPPRGAVNVQKTSPGLEWVHMLETMAEAADAISMSDVIDGRIHAEQLFELAPAHAFLSTVLPGHLCQDGSVGGNNRVRLEFPALLGNTSRVNKQRRTTIQFRDTLMLNYGQLPPRELALDILPILRDICLSMASSSSASSSRCLESRQRLNPLTIDALARVCSESKVDDAQLALLTDVMENGGGSMARSTYDTLAHMRRPTQLVPYEAFVYHLRGHAPTTETWRTLLDVALTATTTITSGIEQLATFCATHDIDKAQLELLLTWFECWLPVDQRFAKRIPTAQKAALTRAINKAVEEASTSRIRLPAAPQTKGKGKGGAATATTTNKRKLEDMLEAQKADENARLTRPDTPEQLEQDSANGDDDREDDETA